MSLDYSTRRSDAIGNNTNAIFSFFFRVDDEDELLVVVADPDGVETILVLEDDYTFTSGSIGSPDGGSVELVDDGQAWMDGAGGLSSDYSISLVGDTPLTQQTDIRNQGAYYPRLHEDTFDKLTKLLQEFKTLIDGMPRLPVTIPPEDFDTTLPSDIRTAINKILTVGPSGDVFAFKEISELISLDGVSLAELGIAPLSTPVEKTFTNNQSATDVAGESYSSAAYRAVMYQIFVVRGTLIAEYRFFVGFNGTTFAYVPTGFDGDDCGLTFSITGTTTFQLQLASSDATNGGTIYAKKHYYPIPA
jgi:hypothetical protein